MKCKVFDKEFKSKLLYIKLYLSLYDLLRAFSHISEGWKQDSVKMLNLNLSFDEMDVKYMLSQADQMVENPYGLLDSITDNIHSLLDTSETFYIRCSP